MANAVTQVVNLEVNASDEVGGQRDLLADAQVEAAAPARVVAVALREARAEPVVGCPGEERFLVEAGIEDHVRVGRAVRDVQQVAAEETVAFEVAAVHRVALRLAFVEVTEQRDLRQVVAEDGNCQRCDKPLLKVAGIY